MRTFTVVAIIVAALVTPEALVAQTGSLTGFRSYLFVLVAYGAGWLLIGTWVYQMSRRLKRVSEQLERLGAVE